MPSRETCTRLLSYWAPYEEYASFTPRRANFNEGYVVRIDRSAAGDADFTAAKAQIMQSLSEKLQAQDTDRLVRAETMDELKKTNLGRYIIINAIVGGVAVLLVVVTALGNYGQMSYTVLKRTRQIGIRRALGATRSYIYSRDRLAHQPTHLCTLF
jgi:ABC-type antimicrobial peptide transport system permease subunit